MNKIKVDSDEMIQKFLSFPGRELISSSGILAWGLIMFNIGFGQQLISLDEARREALKKNPELQAVQQEIGIAKASLIGSYLPFPTGLEVEYESGSDKRFGNEGESGRSFSLSQEIEWPLPYLLRRSIASINFQIRDLQIRRREKLILTEVGDAYFALSAAQQKLKASEAIVTLNQQFADIAEQRYTVGDISELEYNLVLAERERSEAENFLMRYDLESTRIEFNRLIGLDLNFPSLAASEANMTIISLDEKELIATALAQRRDFAAAELASHAADRLLSRTWFNLVPNPVVSASWIRDTSVLELNNSSNVSDRIIDKDRHFAWRVSFSLPLANLNLVGADIARSRANKRVAEARREALRSVVIAQVRDAVQRYQMVTEAYNRYQKLLPRLETNIELLTSAFETGQIDLATLLFQKDRLNRAQMDYWDAVLNAQQAHSALERAIGGQWPN